jgi:WD40 repeat protein
LLLEQGYSWAVSAAVLFTSTVNRWPRHFLAGGLEAVVGPRRPRASAWSAWDFSPASKRLAYLRTDSRIAVVDLTSGPPRYLEPTGAGQEYIRFAPDGHRFALGACHAGRWAVEVRDVATGQEVQRSFLHPEKVTHPAWHPDGRTLATCGDDHLIRLWDVASGQLLRVLAGHKSLGINCAFTHIRVFFFSVRQRPTQTVAPRPAWSVTVRAW